MSDYKCRLCRKSFVSQLSFNEHIKTPFHLRLLEEENKKCIRCLQTFTTVRAKTRHEQSCNSSTGILNVSKLTPINNYNISITYNVLNLTKSINYLFIFSR